jgi:hypothetical protein
VAELLFCWVSLPGCVAYDRWQAAPVDLGNAPHGLEPGQPSRGMEAQQAVINTISKPEPVKTTGVAVNSIPGAKAPSNEQPPALWAITLCLVGLANRARVARRVVQTARSCTSGEAFLSILLLQQRNAVRKPSRTSFMMRPITCWTPTL